MKVTGAWWAFNFLMTTCYTANLAAFLTASKLAPNINSLEDLAGNLGATTGGLILLFILGQYETKYSVINDSDAHLYFEKMAGIEK